jgi:predicted ATPase/DNA-binding CsgD family transcriptional regulator
MPTTSGGAISSPALIGRDAQVAALTELLMRAFHGQGHLALISGEAGIGKSRLVAEVAALATARGARWLRGRCFEQDRSLPYTLLADVLRAFGAGYPADLSQLSLSAAAAAALQISPELAAALPKATRTPALEPEQEKRRIFQGCAQFVQHLMLPDRPLLLILEDLHWCDDTSLEWVQTLSRDLAAQPLLVLLTYRSDEVSPKLNQLLASLDRLPHVSELVLPRLSPTDMTSILQAIFDLPQPPRAEFLDALYGLTEGNPLFIEEVLKSLIAGGDIYREGGTWTRKPIRELRIPRTVQVAVQQRTQQLDDGVRDVLTLAAVVGRRFDFGLMQAITNHSEAELLRLVKQLIAAQLVTEEADDQFAFRHALTRQAIYSGLLARERRALHRAVAKAIERCYAAALDAYSGALAYHCYEAGLWAPAMEWAQRAADHASRLSAHSEALSQYERARQCAEQLQLPDQLARIDHAIGKIQRARGQFRQAIDAYTAALNATSDAPLRAVIKADMGEAYVGAADERALSALSEALSELDPATQPREFARATLWLGRYYHLRAQYAQAFSYFDRALPLLESLDDTASLRFAYHYMAATLLFVGRFAESAEWSRRCVALGEALNNLSAAAVGYWYLAQSALYLGQWQATYDEAERGRALVQALERQSGVHYMDWAAIPPVSAAYYQGELAAGLRLGDACAQMAAAVGDRRAELWIARVQVMLLAARGAEDRAYALAERTLRDADQLVEVTIRCWSRMALADLLAQREEWSQASELYDQCAALLAGTQSHVVQMELGAPMALAYCAQGRLAQAAQLAATTLELTQTAGARHFEAAVWRAQGQIAAAQGQDGLAMRAFDTAIAQCEALGSRLELAHALYQRGAFHYARQRAEPAQADWARAQLLCGECSAGALLWRVHAALGQLALEQRQMAEAERAFAAASATVDTLVAAMHDEAFREHLRQRAARQIPAELPAIPRRSLKTAFGGLTERERTVAVLIARGCSNREIAETLILSERTVTTHVSNIFAKLGFTSRAQVATWAGEKGLASSIGK